MGVTFVPGAMSIPDFRVIASTNFLTYVLSIDDCKCHVEISLKIELKAVNSVLD